MPIKRGYNESQQRLFQNSRQRTNPSTSSISIPPNDFELLLQTENNTQQQPRTPRTPASGQGSATTPELLMNYVVNWDVIYDSDEDETDSATAAEKEKAKKKATRGPVSLKRTAELVTNSPGHVPFIVGWDEENNTHTTNDSRGSQTFILNLGAVIRSEIPLTKPTLADHGEKAYEAIHDRISPFYRIDRKSVPLLKYISKKCNKIYSNYKCDHQELWKRAKGRLPKAFVNRRDEWEFLSSHFASEEFKAMSDNMKDLRAKENKYDHTSGPTPFSNRALAHKNSKAPHIEAYMTLHQKNAPHVVDKLKKAIDAHLAIEQVNQSILLDGTVRTEESTICLPKDKEIVIFEEVLGPSKGTMVHGMGGVEVRNSKKRGPAKGFLRGVVETQEVIEKLQGVVDQKSKEIEVMKAALEKEHNERKFQESLTAEKFKEMYAMMAQMGQARGGGVDGNGGSR